MHPSMQILFQLTPFKIPFMVHATQTPAEVPCPPERDPSVHSSTAPLGNIHRSMQSHTLTSQMICLSAALPPCRALPDNSCQSPAFRILKARFMLESLHQKEERGKAAPRLNTHSCMCVSLMYVKENFKKSLFFLDSWK